MAGGRPGERDMSGFRMSPGRHLEPHPRHRCPVAPTAEIDLHTMLGQMPGDRCGHVDHGVHGPASAVEESGRHGRTGEQLGV